MWQPDISSLDRLSQILSQASKTDNKTQKAIYQSIDELSKNPEFYNYLAFIVGINSDPNITALRQVAALTLKASLERNFENVPDANLNYVKSVLLQTFNDPVLIIRRSVSIVVVSIIFKSGFHEWPELLKFMTNNLDSSDPGIIENTIDCISKLVEEFRLNSGSYDFLVSKGMGQPLNDLLPKLLQMCSAKVPPAIRAVAILTLNHFIYAAPPEFLAIIKEYFGLLYDCCVDSDAMVRQRACQGVVALLESHKDLMLPYIDKILDRIIVCCGDPEYEVARNACFFWEEYLI